MKTETLVLVGVGGFIAYKALAPKLNGLMTNLNKVGRVADNVNGIADKVKGGVNAFAGVSNALNSIATGVGKLFDNSGSGARSPVYAGNPNDVLSGTVFEPYLPSAGSPFDTSAQDVPYANFDTGWGS